MQKIIEKSGFILALALLCQVNAQISGSFGGGVPVGRPGPYEAGAGIGLQYNVPSVAENGAYGPGGYQGYGGGNDNPVGPQGGNDRPIPPGNRPPGWNGGYFPGDSSQGWTGGYYPGGRPPMGFGRPGRRPGFRPPGWYNNNNPGDGAQGGVQGGFNVGGRPGVGFGRPGRRPGPRPPFGPGWPNGFYIGNNFPGGYFPSDKPQEGVLINGVFYPVNKPQNENNKPVPEEKPTQDGTVNQAEERPPQSDNNKPVPEEKPTQDGTVNQAGERPTQSDSEQGGAQGAETDDLPVFQANTEVGSEVTVNSP